ncbi:hypothetical protein [Methylobacterium nigriterrae]|uniref:hypothetical protein n=1 Tax=Methylobacterium nigriterrae TaxID=3127512 RepID=UPI003013A094
MPSLSLRTARSESLFAEACARLPLFEDLSRDSIERLSASGFGRGFLTASLRARLRKADFRDLGHLAQSSPDAIAKVRKFGPVRLEAVRTFILEEIARSLAGAREMHTLEATRERRLARLRAMPVERLSLDEHEIAALGFEGGSCADIAGRSRLELLRAGVMASSDLDRIVTSLARFLREGRPIIPPAVEASAEAPAADTTDAAARRAALLAEQDREWEEAAPAGGRRRAGAV